MAYREAHGTFPEYLSQLVPDYVDAAALSSPRDPHGRWEHTDPGVENPSYGFEFSNVVYRDGRTFAEIKEVQRSEWGDVVPILRAFGFSDGIVLNMAYGGELYETRLNWEWDAATLDVVEKLGWGPGLEVGEFSEVRVSDAGGNPVAGAEVWADGRHYSFDLPNRPFTTDAEGLVNIPLGADLDRTNLVLRVQTEDGQASPAITFPSGAPPESVEIAVTGAPQIAGRLLDAAGDPVADTRIYLKNDAASLGTVKTDADGAWKAQLHRDDVASLRAVIAAPGTMAKFAEGVPVDIGDTANAVIPWPE